MLDLKKKKAIKIVAIVLCAIASFFTLVLPFFSFVVYEGVFSRRYETPDYLKMSYTDFDGLVLEECTFESDVSLAGYKYSRSDVKVKGVVVISHGHGDGGHNKFLPYIDEFTKNGFYVFAYDAQGNDGSSGASTSGLPQGIIDLDSAISYAKTLSEYQNLPFMLFGHSWGAYSVGSVLNLHPEIKAAVLVSGFNDSDDMLTHYPKKYVGSWIIDNLFIKYVDLYERIKFGKKYTELTVLDGLKNSSAKVLVVHSSDDQRVLTEYGYDLYYEEFSKNERFEFILYENEGHSNLLYSKNALNYRNSINEGYKSYLEKIGKKDKSELKEKYLSALTIDKELYFDPNPGLLIEIIDLFESVSN